MTAVGSDAVECGLQFARDAGDGGGLVRVAEVEFCLGVIFHLLKRFPSGGNAGLLARRKLIRVSVKRASTPTQALDGNRRKLFPSILLNSITVHFRGKFCQFPL